MAQLATITLSKFAEYHKCLTIFLREYTLVMVKVSLTEISTIARHFWPLDSQIKRWKNLYQALLSLELLLQREITTCLESRQGLQQLTPMLYIQSKHI